MPTSDSHDYELIDRLAEEFAKRFRDGERPSVHEYCDKYPHIAEDLRDMLPALAEVEQVKDAADAPPSAPAPKLKQVDEYHILREVGRGGMGVVYEAEDTRLGRRVALKVLATGKAGHALERFKREARAAARLHHTNIVPVFGVGDCDGLPYYVMQFIQGLGLDEVLDEVKRLQAKSGSAVLPAAVSARPRKDVSAAAVARSLVTGTFEPPTPVEAAETLTHVGQVADLPGARQVGDLPHGSSSAISLPGQSNLSGRKPTYFQSVAQIGLQIADALDYAHKQGILHRDIKPSNLLLDLHGVVWVTDFGLAKAADQEDLTHTGDVLGTLRYMPPEAFEGKSEPRSDVYSLGLSLYELLALRPAFDERKKEQLVLQVTTTDPPRLGTLNRTIPRDLQTIVHKAIEKDPDHRYRSAADLAADLRRFLADQTILARRVSPAERFARWCKRNPSVAGLTAAVFILLVGVAFISTAMAIRIEGKAEEARFEANRANDETDRANTALANEAHERQRADGESRRKDLALEEAAKERRRTEELIGEQFVSRGAGLLAQGDVAGAALCYAQALKLDPNDPDRALTHRIRLTAALRDAPRPRHVLNHPARVVCAIPSADGKLLATGCEDRTVRVWDVATGNPAGPPLKFEQDVDFVSFAAGNKRLWVLTKVPAAPPAKADPDDADDDPPPTPAPFEASLWDRETGKKVFSGKRNYGTQFALVDPATGRGMVAFNPEPNVLETRDRDTAEPTHPPLRLPGPNTWSTASLRAGREVVACRVEPKPADPKVEPKPAPKTTRKSGRPVRPVLLSELRVFDSRTGAPVFQTPPSPGDAAAVCGTDDRFLVVAEAAGAIQWYELATGKKGPRVERPADLAPPGPAAVAVTGDHRRLLVNYSEAGRALSRAPTAEVRVLDADTGAEVSASFTLDRPVTNGRVAVVPNIDASRFFRGEGAAHLLRADGTSLADQPDPTAGAALAFSPDGGFLLTAAADNMIRVWDAWTVKPATPRLPHEAPVRTADFTRDGSHVLTVSGTTVRLWPLARADQGQGVRLEAAGVRRVLSADGTRLLEYPFGPVGDRTVRVIDCATGRVVAGPPSLWPEDEGGVRLVIASFRPDGRGALFVVREPRRKGAEGVIQAPTRVLSWDCDGSPPKELFATESPHTASAEYSPDGRFVRVTVAQEDYRVRLWDAATGQPVGAGVTIARPAKGGRKDPPFTPVSVGTWSPDSAVLAHRDAAGVHLYDARTGAEVGPPITFDSDWGQSHAFSDDGSRLVTVEGGLRAGFGGGGAPDARAAAGQVRVWEARSVQRVGPPLTGDRLNGVIASVRLSPAGDRVAVVMAAAGPQAVRASSDFGTGLAVYLWDPAAGRPTAEPLLHDQPVTRLAFSPDGQWLLTGTARHLRLWSAATGELQRMIPTAETIADAAFSPDGRRIIVRLSQTPAGGPPSTQRPGFIQVWDVRTGQPMTPPLRSFSQPGPGGPGGFRPGSTALPEAQYGDRSQNADRLLVTRDDGTPELYSLAGDDRPAADLVGLTELLSTRQVNTAGVIQGLGPAGFRAAWESRRPTAGPDRAGTPIEGSAWDRFCLPRSAPLGGLAFPAARPVLLLPERASQYLWHLDRLLAADPKDADLHALRGRTLNNRGDLAAAEAAFGRALDLGSANRTSLLVSRGNLRAELGRWADAEADMTEFLAAPRPKQAGFPGNGPRPVRAFLAVLRLRRGDLPGYRAECARLLDESNQVPPSFGAGTESQFAYLWPALLTDGAVPNLTDVLRDLPVPSWAADNGTGPFNLMVGLRYRQERYEEVEQRFSGLLQPTRSDYYFLAMAQHKLGKAEARATLEKANTLHVVGGPVRPIATGFAITGTMTTWQHKVAEETLRREAEALILGKK